MINRPGYRPQHRIIVSTNGPGKFIASAYREDGLAMEHIVADSENEALLQLSGKLLDRLWDLNKILDVSKGSIAHTSVVALYPAANTSTDIN